MHIRREHLLSDLANMGSNRTGVKYLTLINKQ